MADDRTDPLIFFCNGKKVTDKKPDPDVSLLDYLRKTLQLTGAKEGCGVGACGACTVMISSANPKTKKIHHSAINACLYPVCAVHGKAVTTVEGIGSTKTKLHAVQERLAKAHGSQCGFCTPGMVMSMYTLLRNNPQPSSNQLIKALEGNLCRCTGYRPILDAFKTFTKEPCGENCRCVNGLTNGNTQGVKNDESYVENYQSVNGLTNGNTPGVKHNGSCGEKDQCVNGLANGNTTGDKNDMATGLYTPGSFADYDPSQDIIYPPELLTMLDDFCTTAWFRSNDTVWANIGSLDELLTLKSKYPAAPIIGGNTALGIQKKFTGICHPIVLVPNHVRELNQVRITDTGLEVGAMVTISQLSNACDEYIQILPKEKIRPISALIEILDRFAGEQIRNVAVLRGIMSILGHQGTHEVNIKFWRRNVLYNPLTIGGHLKAAQPHSDLNSFFLAAGCSIEIAADRGIRRTLLLSGDFFPSRWKTNIGNNEVIVNINIPFSKKDEYINVYKVSRRNHVDTAIVNGAFKVKLDAETSTVVEICLVFGGMAAITKVASGTSSKLLGKIWNKDLLPVAYDELVKEMILDPSSPGGMVEYRHSLVLSCFYKFYIDVLKEAFPGEKIESPAVLNSVIRNFEESFPRGTQLYQPIPEDQSALDPIGRPVVHMAALQQTTGEAEYMDDVPPELGETYFGLVMSKKAHANIVSIDTTAAVSLPGVLCYVGAEDVPGENSHDDVEVFASKKVEYFGQIIGGIVASSQEIAHKAAKLVRVDYEELPPIITIKDAIEKQSFFSAGWELEKGNVDDAFQRIDHVRKGVINIGPQEHFYIETTGCIAKPKEDGEMDIHSPVQWPAHLQSVLCKVLDERANHIYCHVRRIGGAFGGKCYNVLPQAACAVAAKKCGKPVRMVLSRTEDMAITGNRQPTYVEYKAGFANTGVLQALEVHVYAGAGVSLDCTTWVMAHLLFNLDSVYAINNVHATASLCKTNKPSNTAFRGYGAPEAVHIIENIMYDIATVCQLSQIQVREINLQSGKHARTYYGTELDDFDNFHRCWKECVEKSNYPQRRRIVDVFNSQNRWTKRGIALTPNRHLVGMLPAYKMQGSATVLVYVDGSVLIHHGGIEMGQGIYTKMIQVASHVLGISHELIYCQESSTSSVPNQTSSSASCTADRNGFALKEACETIVERLAPYRKSNPKGSWKDWIKSAYMDRVNLTANGFYKNIDIDWSWETKTGRPFMYPVYGAALSEVEVDCLTGSHQVLRTDIVMDIGRSMNPAIDIGQIEGAFMQGYGLFALEDHQWSPYGMLLTNGPHAYKIPCFMDIPSEFNVTLLRNSKAERAVYSSKGVSEPPLPLANSVFFAIKDAIQSARADVGLLGTFTLDSPATAERVRLACADSLVKKFPVQKSGKDWAASI